MTKILLWEDNGGGLLIGNPELGWFDVTGVQYASSFQADAAAMAAGDTSDWTVEHYDHDEEWGVNAIASFEDGKVEILDRPGIAGKSYLRLPKDWVFDPVAGF